MAAWVEATTREMGQSLINPDKPSVSASALPGDTEKPALSSKPHLMPKPFSLQRNATVRPIRAPKTNFSRQIHRAVSSETLLNTTDTHFGGPKTSNSNGTVNGSGQSAAPKPVPLTPKPDLQAKPKPEPTKSPDITASNNQTGPNSKPDVIAEDMKSVQPRSRAKSLGAQDQKTLNQKAQGEAGDTEANLKVPSRCWPARNRLSTELTSKFESLSQPEKEVITVRRDAEISRPEKEEPPCSPSAVSESKSSTPPVEIEEAGDEELVGGSIKRRISLLFDRSAASKRRDTFNKRDITPAEISIDIKQRIQNLSLDTPRTRLPSTGAPKSPPSEKMNERSSERETETVLADKPPNTTEIKNSAASVENAEQEENNEVKEDKENYVTVPVYRRVGVSIDAEKMRKEEEEKQRKDEQLEKKRQQQEEERHLEEERKAKEIERQQEEERKQEEEKQRKMEERRKQEEEWKRKIEEERKEKERERQREQERQIEKEKERQREEERLIEEKVKKEREMEEERKRIQETERQKEEERLRKKQEMEKRRKEKEMEEEKLKEEERLRQEQEKERLKKEKEMEEERRRIQEMERQKEEERLRKEREKEELLKKEREMEEERRRIQEMERLRQEREKEERLKKEREMEEERLKEEERLRQEREKERLKKEKEMEEERRRVQEMERQKEEERLRKEREKEERLKKEREMEEERRRVQEMEKQKEEERLRKEREKEERLKKEREMEEERRRVQEMERQKEEERLRKQQEIERIKKEREIEERKRMEEERLRQEREREKERLKKEEERRRIQEMERQKEEENLRQERESARLKKEMEMERCKAVERLREEAPTSYDLISFGAEDTAASPSGISTSQEVSPQLSEVLYDDFSVKPRRWGTRARRSSTPSPPREPLAGPVQNLQPEPKSNDPGSLEPCGDQVNVDDLMGFDPEASSPLNSSYKHTDSRKQTCLFEEETESRPEDLLVPEAESDEGQLKDCEPEEDGVAEEDTETLIEEPDERSENNDETDGLGTESRLSQALQRLNRVRRRNTSTDSEAPDVPDEEESEPLPVLETTAPPLDSSVLRSKVDLAKKRSIKRSRPTRAVRQRSALPALTEGTNPDWRFCDSTDAKDPCSNGGDSESEEEPSQDATSSPAHSQPKRVPMFPGMDPSALMAQLKRRSGVVEADSPTEAQTPPAVPARSPRTPTMALGPRVLPPVNAKDSGSGSSPSWLLELKSKKRMNQPESEA